ncbi:hypothetical protein ASG17_06035 [Brevundimonas sp. Leaf363]|nr:hypothetical protein ASG17_06035 [Brevundimonas sp. Leaf363]
MAHYDDVVLAGVTSAERLPSQGWNVWRVWAEKQADIQRSGGPATFEFGAALSSTGCGQTPLPPPGELWVLYLSADGQAEVIEAYPLEYVRRYDPRLSEVR